MTDTTGSEAQEKRCTCSLDFDENERNLFDDRTGCEIHDKPNPSEVEPSAAETSTTDEEEAKDKDGANECPLCGDWALEGEKYCRYHLSGNDDKSDSYSDKDDEKEPIRSPPPEPRSSQRLAQDITQRLQELHEKCKLAEKSYRDDKARAITKGVLCFIFVLGLHVAPWAMYPYFFAMELCLHVVGYANDNGRESHPPNSFWVLLLVSMLIVHMAVFASPWYLLPFPWVFYLFVFEKACK